jgi:histidyl-tRNA synthetase
MRDFYPAEMSARNRLFDAWRQSAHRYGFSQYDACVVEQLCLLKRKAGEEIVNQIYAFTDKSGREIALRPEMTPSLARMVAARQGNLVFPLRWFAIAQCFRYERMTKGRKREHYQWNLDIVGEASVAAEADILATAADALAALGFGVADYRIHVNHRGLLSELLGKTGIRPDLHPACFLAVDKRGKLPDVEIESMLREAGLSPSETQSLFGLLRIGSLDEAESLLGEATPSTQRLRSLFDLGGVYGIAPVLQFDISVVRGLAYYTGVVFEAFDAQRSSRAIFGGGRYDNLMGDLGGSPMTAVGLGFGDVVVTDLLEERNLLARLAAQPFDLAVGFMQEGERLAATRFAAAMRAGGASVATGLSPEKPKHFFARVGRGGFRQAAYIGPDDVAKGRVRVKDLASRNETEVQLAP